MTGVITRAKVNRADLAQWDGVNASVSRADATGGTVSGLAVGCEVDVVQVYGSGTTYTDASIAAAVRALGSSARTLVFSPGTWTISNNVTIPSNLTCRIPAGCVFSVDSGKTLTFAGLLDVEYPASWYTGSGTVSYPSGPHNGIYLLTSAESTAAVSISKWSLPPLNVKRYGAIGDGSTDDTTAVDAAFSVAEVAGGEVYVPAGTYKITSQITVNINPLLAAGGVTLKGDNKRVSRFKSHLSSGTMLYFGNGSGSIQNGVCIEDMGFDADSASAETVLVRLDYCLDGRVQNCFFNDGAGTQLFLGRAQNVRVLFCEFKGNTSRTNYGIVVDESAGAAAGQGCKIIACTIREIRDGDGIGVWFKTAGGGEHGILSCMIEGNVIGVLLESSRHMVFDNSFENTESTDTQLKVGVSGGTRAQRHNIRGNTFSAASLSNFKCIDLVNYGDITIDGNNIFSTSGTNVYFGSDENNVPSKFVNNECPMTAVSFGGTDGKVIAYGNTNNGTNNPRTTATDLDTTPSVANFDILATANTGATSITDFDDGYPGKKLIVMIEDANTTIVHGTPLKTLTDANLTCADGDILFFEATVGSTSTNTPVWRQTPGLHATQAVAASSGTITVKSGSANNANTTGFIALAPGVYVPYIADPTP